MEHKKSHSLQGLRQRYSREEKQKHLQAQAASGLSAAAYCREHRLGYGNFSNWSRLHRTAALPPLRSIELVAGPTRADMIAEIRFARGQILQVHSGCSEKMAIGLAKVLS